MKQYFKTLIFITLLFSGCSEKEDPSFTSLAGDWRISGEVTGKFTIVETGGQLVVDHGSYTYDGKEYEIVTKRAVEQNQNFQVTIFLLSDGVNSCVLRSCDYDLVGFTSISPSRADCYSSGPIESYYDVKVSR